MRARIFALRLCVALGLAALSSVAMAQGTLITGTQPAVGGVSIDPQGLLGNATLDQMGSLAKLRTQAAEQVPVDLSASSPLRKVSLRRLEASILECQKTGAPLPDAVKYLAGLQRIQYVFVYPEQQDIVLVGPAEGWTIDAKGNVIGATTGRPVILLDDLLVALRSAQQAAQGGISCSIDPTDEGVARVRRVMASIRSVDSPETIANIENSLGLQNISVNGVPNTSHFAQVLVAADYRMKRIAMGFEAAPVRGLPSFLQMIGSGRGLGNVLQRWWLEPKYEPLVRDADGLAWELRGASVKAMTEEDLANRQGQREQTGKANPLAQKWADLMTAKYDELAVAEPVFGQLQNCMDLAIVSALIAKERLNEKAGCSLPVLMNDANLQAAKFAAPKHCESKASVLKKRGGSVVSASGGVMIQSWAIADKTEQNEAPGQARAQAAAGQTTAWWWN